MKFFGNLCAAITVAVFLSACGGGGGGGSDSSSVGPTNPVMVTCPNGTQAATAAACPVITADVSALQGTTQSPTLFNQGITFQFSGSLDPSKTSVAWKQGDEAVAETVAFAAGNKDMTVTPSMHLAYGVTETLIITTADSVGRPVNVNFSFKTSPMSCADNAVWSNPATFSTSVQDCVAPIGVQALMNPVMNTMTDTSCALTVGASLSAACKAYAANGTLVFAQTGVTVNSAAMLWFAYFDKAGGSNLALVDAMTQKVVGVTVLPGPLASIIGNPTGAAIQLGTVKHQIVWNGSLIQLN